MGTVKNFNILYLLFVLLSYSSYAQINIKCAGKKYIIPEFRHDTVKKYFWESEFEKLNILKPIENSKYDIELRGYYDVAAPAMGSVIIIKGNTHKLIAEAYYYRIQRNKADTIPPKGFMTTTGWGKRKFYYSVKTVAVPDTLLKSLIKNNLFSQQNIMAIKDSLANINIEMKPSLTVAFDPYSMTFTIKLKDNYRRFNCDPFAWKANKGIKELIAEILLFTEFNNLYNATGQKQNHLYP